ncbi:YfhO family protein [Staphylococcus aureus]
MQLVHLIALIICDYALNSPFIYHYNGISLYSSIFNGDILKYYDKTLQINANR